VGVPPAWPHGRAEPCWSYDRGRASGAAPPDSGARAGGMLPPAARGHSVEKRRGGRPSAGRRGHWQVKEEGEEARRKQRQQGRQQQDLAPAGRRGAGRPAAPLQAFCGGVPAGRAMRFASGDVLIMAPDWSAIGAVPPIGTGGSPSEPSKRGP